MQRGEFFVVTRGREYWQGGGSFGAAPVKTFNNYEFQDVVLQCLQTFNGMVVARYVHDGRTFLGKNRMRERMQLNLRDVEVEVVPATYVAELVGCDECERFMREVPPPALAPELLEQIEEECEEVEEPDDATQTEEEAV